MGINIKLNLNLVRRATQLRQLQLRFAGIMEKRHVNNFQERIQLLKEDINQAQQEGEETKEAVEILKQVCSA